MSKIAITDYFTHPIEEIEILGDLVGMEVGEDTEVLLAWHEHINEAYVRNLPNLRAVQRYGVGYDSLDIDYFNKKGIIACNNPDYGTDEVADTAIAMILNIARGVSQYNYNAKKFFDSWQENVNTSLRRVNQTTVGIIGAGRIGGNVLMKCNALKFKTVFYDPYKVRGYEKMINGNRVESIDELLLLADIISIHTPLSAETRGLINAKFLNKIKEGASIVNTARGGLFDDLDDLYDALESGKLSNLAIDVLPEEPPQEGKLINVWRDLNHEFQGRLIINPHSSYYSQESFRELRINAAKNALRLYLRETPFNILTKQASDIK